FMAVGFGLSVMLGGVALADEAEDRAALAAALASVNEDDGGEQVRVPTRGSGFFGNGFYITTDRAGSTVGGERFGERTQTQPTAPREAEGIRILNR
ncbi:MAG: hypothetical protein AAFV96_11905, partial [Pseudomonadota bacterium]